MEVSRSVKVLLNGIEAVMVLTLIILIASPVIWYIACRIGCMVYGI